MAVGAIKAGRAFIEVFADDTRLAKGLRSAQAKLKAFGASAMKIGRQLLAPAVAGGALFGLTAQIFAGFESEMLKIKGITKLVGKDFDALTERAKELGRTTSFTAKQVAAGMVALTRAGFQPEEIQKMIGPVLDLARATGTELESAATIGAAAMKQFGLDASQSQRVIDVLTFTVNNSAQTLEDLGEAFKTGAPKARDAGLQIEDLASTLAILADNAIKGSLAGTAVKISLKNLAQEASSAKLKDLGIDAADAKDDFRILAAIIEDVARETQGLGSQARAAKLDEIFGRAATAISILTRSGEEFKVLRKRMNEVTGEARETAEIMDSGLGGAFDRVISAAEGVAIAIGEAFSAELGVTIDAINEMLGALTAWVEENKKVVLAGVGLTVFLGIAGGLLIALGFAANGAAAAMALLAFATRASTIAFIKSPVGILVAALIAITVALGALALVDSPFPSLTKDIKEQNKELEELQKRIDAIGKGEKIKAPMRKRPEKIDPKVEEFLAAREFAHELQRIATEKMELQLKSDTLESALAELKESIDTLNDVGFAGQAAVLQDLANKGIDFRETEFGKRLLQKEGFVGRLRGELITAEQLAALEKFSLQSFELLKPGEEFENLISGLKTISVAGTFSPFAIRGLVGTKAADRTAKATEAIDKGIKDLNKKANQGRLVFTN